MGPNFSPSVFQCFTMRSSCDSTVLIKNQTLCSAKDIVQIMPWYILRVVWCGLIRAKYSFYLPWTCFFNQLLKVGKTHKFDFSSHVGMDYCYCLKHTLLYSTLTLRMFERRNKRPYENLKRNRRKDIMRTIREREDCVCARRCKECLVCRKRFCTFWINFLKGHFMQ